MTRIVLTPEMTRWDSRFLLVVFPSWLSSTSPSAHSKLACFDRPVTQRSFYNMAWSYVSSSSSMRSWQSQVRRSVSWLAKNTWVLLTLCQTNIFHPKAVVRRWVSFPMYDMLVPLEGSNYLPNTSLEFSISINHRFKTAALVSVRSAALGQRQFRQRLGVATQAGCAWELLIGCYLQMVKRYDRAHLPAGAIFTHLIFS